MNVMHVASASTARWSTYTALTQLRNDRAQLRADIAAKARPEVIAADRASLEASRQELARRNAARVDVTV